MDPSSFSGRPASGVIYRGMADLLRKQGIVSDGIPSVNSAIGQDMLARRKALEGRSVDPRHIAAITGIAQIDHGRRAEAAEAAELEELAELMEEAPGA